MTAGPGSGSAMGLRGAFGGAGGLRQAGDGLKSASECISDRAPQNSFLPPHKRAQQLGACSSAACAVSPPGHLVPRLPDPGGGCEWPGCG